MNTALLQNILVILDEPQDLVNIAGTVRAMKNMGLSRLRLVNPAEFDTWRIEGIAHRSGDLLEGAELFETLEEAVADAVFVVGTSARPRTAHRNYTRPREVARQVVARARSGPVALVFGREDRGLSNQALDLCHYVAIAPTAPDYSSLNLAQAVLLVCYEVALAAEVGSDPLPRGRRSTRPATAQELENTYAALQDGLARIDFFKAREPEAILRIIRTLVARAEPDLQEAGILRAIGYEIGYHLDRVLSEREGTKPPSDP